MTRWPPGATVVVEGFVRGYRNRPNIVVHYAAVLPPVARAPDSRPPFAIWRVRCHDEPHAGRARPALAGCRAQQPTPISTDRS
jgi:hypothetical protein